MVVSRAMRWLIILNGMLIVFLLIGLGILRYVMESQPKTIHVAVMKWVESEEQNNNITAFKERLEELIENPITYTELPASGADSRAHRLNTQRALEGSPDLFYSLTTPGTTIVTEETPGDLPIVFSIVTYPVESGLVASNTVPGGRITGTRNWVSMQQQLSNLLLLAPDVKRIGFVHRRGEANSDQQLQEAQRAADALGVEISEIAGTSGDDLQGRVNERIEELDALYYACDTLVQEKGVVEAMIGIARRAGIPDAGCTPQAVQKGALVGLVADVVSIGTIAAEKAAQVIHGVDPGTIEINTAHRPELLLNTDRIDELGITVPQDVLADIDSLFQYED